MIRIREIKLPFDHGEDALIDAILACLHVSKEEIIKFAVVRKSIDARRRGAIVAVYVVDVEARNEDKFLSKISGDAGIGRVEKNSYQMPLCTRARGVPPVIVGSGPCGLFAALILAESGLRPILIERGRGIKSRIKDVHDFWRSGRLDPESNVQFGEGGAGTFSDGKLTSQIKDKKWRIKKILEEFVDAGAPEEILHLARPHIGTDNLVGIVSNIRNKIILLGGEVRFEAKLTGLGISGGSVYAAIVNDSEIIGTDTVVLALGHSARDTFEMLHHLNISMESKPFSIGVRIEHPQSLIDRAQYGKFAGHSKLAPAEYKLVYHDKKGRSAYTFCMCPGGEVIASSSEMGGVVTNGMSRYSRKGPNANSALLVGISPLDFGEDPLAGVRFQRKWEQKAFEIGGSNYFAPTQLVGDFLSKRFSKALGCVTPSYTPGTMLCDIAECLPEFVVDLLRRAIVRMDNKLKGFSMNDAVMIALESRSSSPIRIIRDDKLQSPSVKGLYPGGEGAGHAGGIISAAVDGIKIAETIMGSS